MITLLLGFSAVNTGNNLLFLVVSGLLAFMSVTGMAGMINIKWLVPELLPPSEIFAGTAAPFRFRLHNTKRHIPSFLIRLECNGAHPLTLPVIAGGSTIEENIGLIFDRRGPARIATITISSPFPVNFFNRYWKITLDSDVIVFPRLQPSLHTGDGNEAKPKGIAPRRDRGDDGELEKIAAYSGREPLRVIHWKLSARSNDLQVKQFGRQSAVPLVIDLDALAGNSLEERISRAAWLVRRWVGARPVGLNLGGREIAARIGPRHGAYLLTELAMYGLD